MPREQRRENYEQSLGEWRARLQAANRIRKPLIEKVTNTWREDEKFRTAEECDTKEPSFCDLDDENSFLSLSVKAIRSRRFQRMFAVLVLVSVGIFYIWTRYIRPGVQEGWELKQGFLPAQVNGTYGVAQGGHFDGVRIKDIDTTYVPGGKKDPKGNRRLIFVGDIHGCKDELKHLLKKVDFNSKTDHLVATGDVVSKGPDSPGVLDLLIHHGAESVRGNHEDRLLEAAKTLSGSNIELDDAASTSKGYSKDAQLLKELKPHHMRFLHDMPLMLRIPALPFANSSWRKDNHKITEETIVIHAGLVPHVPLERQDPYFVMNMRSIDHKTHVPSALRETKKGNSKPWMHIWNWYNNRLAKGRSIKGFHIWSYAEWLDQRVTGSWISNSWSSISKKQPQSQPQVAVYGHDSKMGLQMHRWSKGLDTGCVSGGKLTAMVLDAKGKTEIVQVKCENYRA
ncbi:hypothetical protein LTR86_004360 [Recurvomyces mirabilis]|nr:hypothetical protein LTR86_004360 [Recurvomyces mirabilis]